MTDLQTPQQKTQIRGLLDAANSIATKYREIYAGGEPVTMPAPRILGPGRCDEITGLTRRVFLAAFDDAVIRSRFDGIEVQGRMLFDYQGHEIDRIAAECLPDKFWSDGAAMFALHEAPRLPVLEIDEALNLVGNNATNFGHWIIEHILKWATIADSPELQDVPVLIDGELHPSHREALEFFMDGRAQVIILPKDATARVGRLWTLSNWIYIPIYWRDEDAIHPEFIVWPVAAVAERYRRLANQIKDDPNVPMWPKRVFFNRRGTQHRKLINIEEIEDIARARGFDVCYPEDLKFSDQLRLVRGATHIMGPEGSAFFLAFFGRPGTKLICFDHPFVEKIGFADALFKELGIDLTVLTGACVRKDELFSRFSDYVIDPADLYGILDEWEASP